MNRFNALEKLVIVLLLAVYVFDTVPTTNAGDPDDSLSCIDFWHTLSKKSEQALSPIREKVQQTLTDKKNITPQQLYHLFDFLKAEEETFAIIYTNRSPAKRNLTENEIDQIKKTYQVPYLTNSDVQHFYANEIMKLYALIEETLREFEVRKILKQIEMIDDIEAYEGLMHALIVIRNTDISTGIRNTGLKAQDFFGKLPSFNPEQAKTMISLYKRIKKGEGPDVSSELQKIGLGNYYYQISKRFEKKSKLRSNLCCYDTNCTFCPNNFGLRKKNKKESANKN